MQVLSKAMKQLAAKGEFRKALRALLEREGKDREEFEIEEQTDHKQKKHIVIRRVTPA